MKHTNKNTVYYALWSDYTDSIITSLCDSIEELNTALNEEAYDRIADDKIKNCSVCKIEILEKYMVNTKFVVVLNK